MGRLLPISNLYILKFVCALILILGLFTNAMAQQRSLGISGVIKEDRDKLSGVSINIYKGSSRVEQFTTDGSGRFDYPLDVNNLYIVEISKPGYVSKKLSFNTTVPDEENLNWTFDFVVDLFKVPDGVDLAVFKNPVAKVHYNDQFNDFDYDLDYSMEFKKKEEEVMKKAEQAIKQNADAAKTQAEEEKREQEMAAKAEAAKQAQLDKEYKDAVAEGDKEFKAGNMDAAFNAYIKASEIKPSEQYPKDKIDEVNLKMQEKRKTDIKYYSTIEKGDDQFKEGMYQQALVHYKEAADIRSDNKEALDKIKEAEAKLTEEKKKDEEYQKHLAEADKLFKDGKFAEAKSEYEAALILKPSEKYPEQQINVATARIESVKKREENYAAAIENGDKEYAAGNYDEALKAYQSAQSLKPDEKYPKSQVAAVTKLQEEVRKQTEVYDKFMEGGDKAMQNEKYAEAKMSYEQALKVKKDSEDALKKLQEAEAKLAAIELQEKEYADAIANGDKAFKDENYAEAKSAYEKALSIKPDEKHPKDQITAIDAKMAEAKKQEEQNKAYNEAIAAADKAFAGQNYEDAKGFYEDALVIKSKEKYPEEQISKIDVLVKEAKKTEEAFAAAIAKGDREFKSENYVEAKSAYEEALQIKKDDEEALKKLQDIEAKLAAIAREVEEYNSIIASADDAFRSDQLDAAKSAYEKALGIRPNEKYPKEQIAAIASRKSDLEKQKQLEQAYADAVALGDKELNSENYDAAISAYKKAIAAKPTEEYPSSQIEKIGQIIKESQKADEAYEKAMANGDKAFKSDKYADAKSAYETALGIKKDDERALKKLQEVEAKIASLEMKEKEYADAIDQADNAFKSEDYETAKAGYDKALKVKPDEKYPKEQLAAIEKKIAEIREKENIEKSYTDAITKGDKAFAAGDYTEATAAYEKALDIKSKEKYPTEQLSKIEQIMKDSQKADEEFAKIMERGDKSFKDEKYLDAKSSYEQALALKKDSQEALKKLQDTEAKLASIAEKEQAYNDLIAKADSEFGNQEYEVAKVDYEKALKQRPDDKHPKQRIEEIASIMAKSAEVENSYQATIKDADVAFGKKDWEKAKSGYEAALGIKPDEEYPKDKIEEIGKILADKVAQKDAYESTISSADALFKDGEYDAAKTGYKQALELKSNEKYPSDKIKEIDDILKRKEELEKNYKSLVAKADASFGGANWEAAIDGYKKALELKPNEQYPKDKIREAENNIKSVEQKDGEYQIIIAQADKDFKANKFTEAKDAYTRALSIKPNEKYPKDQLAEIDRVYEQLKAAVKKKELEEAEKIEREAAAKKAAQEQAKLEAEAQKKKEAAIEAAKEEARQKAEEDAQLVAERTEVIQEQARLEEEKRAEEMQKNAQLLLEQEIAEEEERIRAEAERKIRKELEAKLTEEQTKLEEELAQKRAQEAQEKRKAELEERKKAEEEAFISAQEKAKRIAEEEKLKREQEEAERKAKEEAIALAAKEKAAQEEEMRKKVEEEIRIARQQKEEEERAKAQAELEARKQAEKEAFEKAQAEAQARIEAERKAKEEREAAEKVAREAKIEEAKRKAEEERRVREEEEIRKKAEAVALAEAAKARRAAEEQARIEEENRRKEFVANRAEETKAKEQFEKTAKEIAQQTAREGEQEIYDEVRKKLEAQYEGDFAALDKKREEGVASSKLVEGDNSPAFKNDLGKKYPVGITEETVSEANKKITKLVVNRSGNANEYQKVKWNWGGVYYFKNGESISKTIFDAETKW